MADVLLQLMNASSTNALETGVCNLQEKSSMLENDIAEVGGSLEPSLVLLNHSCDPNTIRINCQGHIILMANRNISEGQEISIGYYLTYAETDMEARQKYLKRKYLFDCKCPACAEKWPTKDLMPKSFDDLNENQMMFDMENTMMLMQQVNKIQKVGSSISQEQRAGNYKKAFGLCIEFIKVLQDTLKKPHSYYLMAEKSLFKLAWILHGSHLR